MTHRVGWKTVGAAAAVMGLLVAACGSGSSSASSAHSGSKSARSTKATTASTTVLPIASPSSWGTSWSYNPYSADGYSNSFLYLNLALQDPPSLTKFSPQLASSWSMTPRTFTIHLQPKATWQNGRAVTSKDVYDTVLLDGTNDTGFWNDIADVSAPSSTEVVFTLRKGEPATLAQYDILTELDVYPASVYGRFVTPGLKADELAYYAAEASNPATVAKLPQYQAIVSAFDTLTKFAPSTLMGDGPFELKGMTTAQARLTKWNGFYDASKIPVAGITFLNGTNQGIYPELFGGEAEFSSVYMPPSIVDRWLTTPDAHLALPYDLGFVMEFNDHTYPLDITKVRQALAYVIPRKEMTTVTYGKRDAGGTVETRPDGIDPTVESLYLTKSQVDSLNTYPVNLTKAAALLRSAGFHKRGGVWITPKGQPFTLSLLSNAANTDIVTTYESAANALSAFGIHSSVDATNAAAQSAAQSSGQFTIGPESVSGDNPLEDIDAVLGSDNNFTTLGTYAGDRGIGFGPTAAVPGLGSVDVASTIDTEAHSVAPGPTMDKLAWDWARLVNEQVPYLWYAAKVHQYSYSTAHLTDWPPMNKQHISPLWNIISSNETGGLILAFEEGYIRPRS